KHSVIAKIQYCILIIFCLYCGDTLQDLHSFPTRRSSDLDYRAAGENQIGLLNAVVTAFGLPPQAWITIPIWNSVFLMVILIWIQDRKSTRLNSSHVKISYAVFCLKKKSRIIILIY